MDALHRSHGVARRNAVTARAVAITTAVLAIGYAVVVGRLGSQPTEFTAPEDVPRGLMLAVTLATPGIVAVTGLVRNHGPILIAAALTYMFLASVAFSGVLLGLLIPSVVFARAAAGTTQNLGGPVVPRRRWLLVVVLALPVALVIVATTGIIGLIGLVTLAMLLQRGRHRSKPVALGPALIGIAAFALMVGGAVVLFTNTQTICWNARETASGFEYQRIPVPEPGAEVSVGGPGGFTASGCDSGQFTTEGAGASAVLLVGAIALSATVPSRP